jgi:peptide/nickel transport system permease protein
MRVADVQLSFPAILIALLIDGLARAALPKELHDQLAVYVLILAIAASGWVGYARTVRGSTLVERNKEYVQAALVIGRHPLSIMFSHVLPNVLGPVLVIATLQIGAAIITESSLSFLGVGVPPTQPSLGTLIRIGNDFLFSGEWWITVFPGLALVILVSGAAGAFVASAFGFLRHWKLRAEIRQVKSQGKAPEPPKRAA